MSEATTPQSTSDSEGDRTVTFTVDDDAAGRIERAADELGLSSESEFVTEAVNRLVAETIDDGGRLECPHDDCDRTFATHSQRRGHLGSTEHALDVPEGDFWCGYCGYGPSSWHGLGAHHGHTHEADEVVRLDEEPDSDDLIAPDDIPDHKDEDLLRRLYDQHDGNHSEMCREHNFDVCVGTVRKYLIDYGIHDVTPQEAGDHDDEPVYHDPDWLEEKYAEAGGNISEMHRQVDVDVPYRTLHNHLKKHGVHDPTESPGRSHGQGGPGTGTSTDDSQDADETSETAADDVDDDDAQDADDSDDEPEPEDDGEQATADETQRLANPDIVTVDSPDDVESFDHLAMPDWLDAHSFHTAVEMSDDLDDLVTALGWDEPDWLADAVRLLDLDVRVGDADD